MNRPIYLPAGIIILIWFIPASCEPTFEPIQENDRYFFSMYGYLDSSADTNWVRVMPVREEMFPGPEPIDATVTIEDLGNEGQPSVMNDSLFHYGANAYAYNFWTTMKLEPSGSYRITAKREDGKTSSVTVELPEDFPTPVVYLGMFDQVFIEGVDNLADVQSFHHMLHLASGIEGIFSFSHLADTNRTTAGEYQIWIDPEVYHSFFSLYYGSWDPPGDPPLYNRIPIQHRQFFIASAGPDWHHFPDIDENIIALPDGISNVEDGVGYVVGIVSKTIPYKSCFDDSGSHVPCPVEKPMRDP